jgi:hypothetical protein
VIPRSADPGSTAMIAVTDVLGDLHTLFGSIQAP